MAHWSAIGRLVGALLERVTLDTEAVAACIEGRPLPERTRVEIRSWSERREKGRSERVAGRGSVFPPRSVEPSEG